jgi:predicted Zn-dependent peptidase
VPAIAAAWKMPLRGSADHAPMVVLGEVLSGGNASVFYQGLVKGRELSSSLESLWGLTGPWEYDGPTLFTVFAMYKPGGSANALLAAMDEDIATLRRNGVDAATLQRVKTRMKADWYNGLESFLGRADTLARLQALWGDARVVNRVPGWIDAVTADDLKRVAGIYLTPANRSVIDRVPAPAGSAAAPAPAAASASAAAAAKP